jgi:Beta-galactosidase/beta-glucuronidase
MNKVDFNTGWEFIADGGRAKQIKLPHDAMLEQGRHAEAPSKNSGAYFLGGKYEYVKTFIAPTEWESQDVFVEFEGIYPKAEVYLNGMDVGFCAYGYTGYRFELKNIAYGKENEIKVIVDHTKLPDSRWYSGAGIYRPVWLWHGAKEHIHPDGIRITTIATSPAQILVEVSHTVKETDDLNFLFSIAYDGKEVVAMASKEKSAILHIPDAKLWDADHPELYDCSVTLQRGGMALDAYRTRFGIRKLTWSTAGFTVNGKTVLLKGGCIHHDNGILGAKSYAEADRRRIKRLKEYGFNAIRMSHNPAGKSLLDACDELGMYVMDEGWDMWTKTKNAHDYATRFEAHFKEDITAMVEKDYNHPSVIMYSIGNEVTEPADEKGIALGKELVRLFHEQDATRPVTAGINLTILFMVTMGIDMTQAPENQGNNQAADFLKNKPMDSTAFNEMMSGMGSKMTMAAASDGADSVSAPILDALDIAGYNYASSRYEMEGKKHPDRIVVGSETYAQDLPANWKLVEKLPYLIGDFMWTAWDYLGEVGIGAWTFEKDGIGFHKPYPWLLADTGAFDILGNDNAEAGMASVIWNERRTPYIGIVPVNHPGEVPAKAIWRGSMALPYWSYKGCDGNPAEVEVYSRGHSVELFVNGKSVGKEALVDYKAVFNTIYEHGMLRAIAYDANGGIIGESSLNSADNETAIRILPEEANVSIGDVLYVDVAIVGKNGEIECNSDTCLTVKVEGGELLGFGSANPRTEESFLTGIYTTWYGRSLAAIRCESEKVNIQVSGEGFCTESLQIAVRS